jgi:hypothetical protein
MIIVPELDTELNIKDRAFMTRAWNSEMNTVVLRLSLPEFTIQHFL